MIKKNKKTAVVRKSCVACGNCLKYCRFGAIEIYKGLYAKIDKNACKGCGFCIKACPAGIIEFCETEEGIHEKALV